MDRYFLIFKEYYKPIGIVRAKIISFRAGK